MITTSVFTLLAQAAGPAPVPDAAVTNAGTLWAVLQSGGWFMLPLAVMLFIETLLIFIYLLLNLMLSFGLRPPYSRWSDALLGFLRDVSEPYLRLFRRLLRSDMATIVDIQLARLRGMLSDR